MAALKLKKIWKLLDRRERFNAVRLLVVMVTGAFASAVMVVSVFPFLSVLSNPELINENAMLNRLYKMGGFETEYTFLLALGLAAIVVIVSSNFILILQTWAVTRYTQMRIHSISRNLLSHYLAQPYSFFLRRHTGDMSTNILAEAQQVVINFLRPLANLIAAVLTIIAVLITLLLIDPIVTLITTGTFAAMYTVIAVVTRRYVGRMGRLRAKANEARFRVAGEALGGIKDVKLMGREVAYVERFSGPSMDMARAQIAIAVLSQVPRFAIQMVGFGGIILLCLLLLDPDSLKERKALGGTLPLLGLLAFAGQRLMPELQKVYQSTTMMTSGVAALDRVYNDISGGDHARIERAQPTALGLCAELEFDGVSYTYPGAKGPGLSDVSFSLKAGERVGVVGTSGAGKTTVADMILGLLRPSTGAIVADGIKITQTNLRAWQKTVGYVPQDIFLTDSSLSENIAFGLPPHEIDAEKVERAGRVAQLHDFVTTELPDGYATQIGERGVRLSGGQRQRIGIARALYHDADLIVFDEATSALDNLTEREVMVAIEALSGEKTILMIAHRLSTVRHCDNILFLQSGRIEATGTWDGLIRENASFRGLAANTEGV